MRVLVIDDNKNDRLLLKKLLISNGYEAIEAYNGIEALKYAKESKPVLIISDILMPGMDGFTLVRELKKDEDLKKVPFVFYTAHYVSEKDRELALKLGASRFIVKPVEPKELLNEIETVLREFEAGRVKPFEPLLKTEEEYLEQYSKTVVRKLEEKIVELEKTKNFLDTVLDNMEDGVIMVNPDLKVIYCNKKMQEMIKCEYLQGRMPPESIHAPCIPDMAHASGQLFEVDQLTKNEKIVHLEGIISRITNENGELTEHIGVFRDISERNSTREEMDRKNREIALLSDIDRMFMECRTSDELIESALNRLVEILDVEGGCVYFLDESSKKAKVRICKSMPVKFVELVRQLDLDAVQRILTHNTSVFRSPLSARIAGISETEHEYGTVYIITVQLRSKTKMMGFIDLMVSPYRKFDHAEIDLLEKIGVHLGIVLENLLFYKEY